MDSTLVEKKKKKKKINYKTNSLHAGAQFKLAARVLDVFGQCLPRYCFMLRTLGAHIIAKKKRYMKCTLCLGLVGTRYPSELELPVISSWSR